MRNSLEEIRIVKLTFCLLPEYQRFAILNSGDLGIYIGVKNAFFWQKRRVGKIKIYFLIRITCLCRECFVTLQKKCESLPKRWTQKRLSDGSEKSKNIDLYIVE